MCDVINKGKTNMNVNMKLSNNFLIRAMLLIYNAGYSDNELYINKVRSSNLIKLHMNLDKQQEKDCKGIQQEATI